VSPVNLVEAVSIELRMGLRSTHRVENLARRQIGEALIHSIASQQALRKTFELVATKGPA
jgi:hypothetical protein